MVMVLMMTTMAQLTATTLRVIVTEPCRPPRPTWDHAICDISHTRSLIKQCIYQVSVHAHAMNGVTGAAAPRSCWRGLCTADCSELCMRSLDIPVDDVECMEVR